MLTLCHLNYGKQTYAVIEGCEFAHLDPGATRLPDESRSGSTNLNSKISGNSDVFGLTDMVGQKGVFHGQAQKEGGRRTTRA